jgi:hypothetical protein
MQNQHLKKENENQKSTRSDQSTQHARGKPTGARPPCQNRKNGEGSPGIEFLDTLFYLMLVISLL